MATYNKAQRNINRTVRMTPRDAKVAGTFAEKPRSRKSEPRAATFQEARANNLAMVQLGSVIADLGRWMPLFRAELASMNESKNGRPFEYPDIMVWWVSRLKAALDTTCRLIAGVAETFVGAAWGRSISFSRLNERENEMSRRIIGYANASVRTEYGDGVMAVYACENAIARVRRCGIDSSGLNMSDTTMWRSVKWNTGPKDKGWLKLHALSDVDSGEILAYAVTDETVGDAPLLRLLVEEAEKKGHNFDVLYADGAYASDGNWRFLCQDRSMNFITSFKVNTSPTNNGCLARGDAARLWCSLPYDEWKKRSGYGTRWKCECVFSDLKRIFPETITAKTHCGAIRQIWTRIEVFNEYKGIRASIMEVTGNCIIVA